jgi:hypothetical protein
MGELMFVSMPRYSEEEARAAVAASYSYTEALRRIGLRPAGGNHALFRRYVDTVWKIDTSHFDPYFRSRIAGGPSRAKPLSEVLVTGNLQIVCPNCAATLETHCARKNRIPPVYRGCKRCGETFVVRRPEQRYCSRECGSRWDRVAAARRGCGQRGVPAPQLRRVERPPYEQLKREIEETSYLAVGRKYGVLDNAVRKWVRFSSGRPSARPWRRKLRTILRKRRELAPVIASTHLTFAGGRRADRPDHGGG